MIAVLRPFDGHARGTPLRDGRGAGVRACRPFSKRNRAVAALYCEGGPSSLPFSLISGLPEISTKVSKSATADFDAGEGFPSPFDWRSRP